MKGRELYEYICVQWQSLYKIINIDADLDEDEINVFHDHDLVELSHIVWTVPMTLYQLIISNNKTSKLIDREGYQVVLFVLSLIYTKYHSDDYLSYDAIWWQWRIVTNDNAVMMDYEYLYDIEKKLVKIMDHNMEIWAIGSSDMYHQYYLLSNSAEKREYIYSILE